MVIWLSAKGLTHGEIGAHLAQVYGAEVCKQTITAITDRKHSDLFMRCVRLPLRRVTGCGRISGCGGLGAPI